MSASDNLGPQWTVFEQINRDDQPGHYWGGLLREDFYKEHQVLAYRKPDRPFEVWAQSQHYEDPLYGDNMPNTHSVRAFKTHSGKRAAQWAEAAKNRIDKTGDPNILPNGIRLSNPKRSSWDIWYDNKEEME